VSDKLGDVITLGCGIFRVRTHIEVQPGTVGQKDIAASTP